MGGLVISRAAELAPERVAGLVYVSAFLPRNRDSLFGLGRESEETLVPTIISPNLFRGVSVIAAARTKPVFYGDCTDADVAFAQARVQTQSLRPLTEKVRVTPERFGRTRRFYIACTEDRAVPYAFQEKMMARVGVEDVVRVAAAHSPFLSRPEETAAAIKRFAAAVT
jgi:pimeloyl-ACP methyl ester carboxylesterase